MLYVIPVLVPIEAFTATMSELEQRLRERDDHARDAVILIRQRGIDVRESVAASLNVIAHVDDTSFPSINYACVWTMRKEGLPCSSRPPTRQLANSPCSRKKVQNKLERKSKKKQNPNPTNPS